jgi:exo-beta-1,3-glucanase (GH17 family)
MAYLDFVREFTKKPITTAEVWHTLDKYPEIGNHVDFITVHILTLLGKNSY